MAYADQKASLDLKSLGVTAAVNGGIIAALLLLGTATTMISDPPLIVEQWANPEIEKAPPPPTKQKAAPPVLIIPKTPTPARLESETALTLPPIPPLTSGGSTGSISESLPPIIEVKDLIPPVIVVARRDPRYARDFQPDYPPGMIRAGIEGSVTVRVLVGVDGRVRTVEGIRADQDAFLEVTRAQALRRWRFTPATKDGVAYESWQTITVRFQMPT